MPYGFGVQKTHRAVIAGTGRAGTSFLIDFLRGVGVPTDGLSDEVEHQRARAGLEQRLDDSGGSYLVKDPWLFEYFHEVDLGLITIDALIVPVRDLSAAAMSRVRLERAALTDHAPQLADWSTHATSPGGVIYSLSVTDQERVLAVGLARLLDWALTHDLPLFFLHYPRLVSDPAYVVDTLWPWLQRFTDRESALAVFRQKSDPRRWESDTSAVPTFVPRDEHRDLVAHKEALELVLAERTTEARRQQQRIAELEQLVSEGLLTIETLERLLKEREIESSAQCAELRAQLDSTAAELAVTLRLRAEMQHSNESLRAECLAVRRSRSYRIGRLLSAPWRRWVRGVLGIANRSE